MRRSLLTILIVAAISAWISRGETTAGLWGERGEWVRTVDGWESRGVLEPYEPSPPPPIHPGLVAAFQLGASLFFLAAFPGPVAVRPAPVSLRPDRDRRRVSRRKVVVG